MKSDLSPIPEVPQARFEDEVLASDRPVLVDFFATWCGPCRWVTPYLDEVRTARGDALKVVKVDVDEAQEVALRYRIMSVPTLVLFRDGEEVERSVGLEPHRIRGMGGLAPSDELLPFGEEGA